MSNTDTIPATLSPPRYDMHTHSLRSDGTLTPTELVRRAHAAGVNVLALTDHDVTDGIVEAQAAANRLGMTLIAGVEISVTWRGQTLSLARAHR
jgi:predicted metal-dependent phosphoesterase TrpH